MTTDFYSDRCVVTVATLSHLHWVRVLVASVRRVEGNCDILVLVLDASEALLAKHYLGSFPPGVQLVGGDSLTHKLYVGMRCYFSAFELSCATKAFLLEYALFQRGYRKAVFFDGDIQCYAGLTVVWDALDTAAVVLTPHVMAPFPNDGQSPDDREMATHGFVNGGFWAVRCTEVTHQILDWMMGKVAHEGFFTPDLGLSADQTWLSCLPWYFPDAVVLLRDPGLNVAYWNLQERQIRNTSECLTSNGRPLVFFHFSGFDPRVPERLTRHAVRVPDSNNGAILRGLLSGYAAALNDSRAALPDCTPDLPCLRGSLRERFRLYGVVHGQRPAFADEAIFRSYMRRAYSVWHRLRFFDD